ncbi:hypothetical protein [Melaminivora sp.]|nr:hypothetical protein [Melaminivora sp.]
MFGTFGVLLLKTEHHLGASKGFQDENTRKTLNAADLVLCF